MTPLRCRVTASVDSLVSRFAGALLGLGATGPAQVFLEGTSCAPMGALATSSLGPPDTTPPFFLNTTFSVDSQASTVTVSVAVKDQGSPLAEEVATAVLYISQSASIHEAVAVEVPLDPGTGVVTYAHAAAPGAEYSYWLDATDRAGNSTTPVFLGRRGSDSLLAGSSVTANAAGEIVVSLNLSLV